MLVNQSQAQTSAHKFDLQKQTKKISFTPNKKLKLFLLLKITQHGILRDLDTNPLIYLEIFLRVIGIKITHLNK